MVKTSFGLQFFFFLKKNKAKTDFFVCAIGEMKIELRTDASTPTPHLQADPIGYNVKTDNFVIICENRKHKKKDIISRI